ncbi:hypothetical protein [Desulfosediminicola ganghwensis]|uniref:hypothetical protein n=1 Tax=Desulfosediminicola ganghwensis TaxID=2569540 RepID=UPI0010ACDCB0|nr:hypothetical protein [Desulfosediminicola ganghwensis]
MAHVIAEYLSVRDKMQPGDIIAFSGKGNFSEIIKWVTRSEVSHIGIVFESKVLMHNEAQRGKIVDIFESTTLYEDPVTDKKVRGVQKNRMSVRLKYYEGDMWWLPLSEKIRERLDTKKLIDFLLHQEQKEYDMPQAVKSALDVLDSTPIIGNVTHNREDFAAFFCSELATAALEYAGAIGNINCSEVTPIDLCRFDLFGTEYYQLKGVQKEISGYCSLNPEGYGV